MYESQAEMEGGNRENGKDNAMKKEKYSFNEPARNDRLHPSRWSMQGNVGHRRNASKRFLSHLKACLCNLPTYT